MIWKQESDLSSGSRLRPDLAPERGHKPFGDGEAQPGTACFPHPGGVVTTESLEGAIDELGIESGAFITYRDRSG